MARQKAASSPFEQSFMFHMIRDFFLLLVLVAVVELGIRYASLRYDFSRQEPVRVSEAAEKLANDVKAIMLNSAGPMAAQTVYPILNRNYEDLGLSIAILPSAVTVESMKVSFRTDVQGLRPNWREGPHQASSADLRAEQFCLGCHVKAKVGDVLGTVSVRSYLDRKEDAWWREVRITAGALSIKILMHTIVLFMLLKVRMAPLLELRATVSELARGVIDLSPRADVNTADEFGELAQDLNHFLDRIGSVVKDLDRILGEVVSVGTRLGTLNRDLEQKVDGMRDTSLRSLGDDAQRSLDAQLVTARESGAYEALDRTLAQAVDALERTGVEPALGQAMRDQLSRLRQSFAVVSGVLGQGLPPVRIAEAQSDEYRNFAQSLREMALLEASMQNVAESGRLVLQRLSQGRQGEASA